MIRRLFALARLGLYALAHFIANPFRRSSRAEGRFIGSYLDDRLLPHRSVSRDLLTQAARCTGCGLCDVKCALVGQRAAGHPGPSFVPMALTRALPDLAVVRKDLSTFSTCGDCRACESWCSYGVPLQRLLDDASTILGRLDRQGRG